jgi:hypothetical protein
MTTTTSAPSAMIGDLIMVRLLAVGKHPPTPKRLREELARFYRKDPPNAERWQALIDELVAAGLIGVKPYRLTDAGRTRALEFLGIRSVAELDGLPARGRWEALQARCLVPQALGIPTDAKEDRAQIGKKSDKLEGFVLKWRYGLPVNGVPTLAQAAEALASKLIAEAMGVEVASSLKTVKEAVLSRHLGHAGRLDPKRLNKQLSRHAAGASRGGAKGIRSAILSAWLEPDDSGPAEPTVEEFDPAVFAQTVRAAAWDCPTGRFGDNKVFISHVWRHLSHEPSFPRLDLAEFKTRLAEANHAGLIRLSRADLVQAMSPVDVQESETPYLNAVFHFILIEGGRP